MNIYPNENGKNKVRFLSLSQMYFFCKIFLFIIHIVCLCHKEPKSNSITVYKVISDAISLVSIISNKCFRFSMFHSKMRFFKRETNHSFRYYSSKNAPMYLHTPL